LAEVLHKDPVCHSFYSTYTETTLPGRFGIVWRLQNKRKVTRTVKNADELVLLAKEETVLLDMFGRLIEIGRCYGMEMNVENTEVLRISRQGSRVKIMINQKQLQNVVYLNCLGSMMTYDVRRAREIKFRVAMKN
jgi:hypothetical protein